MPLFQSDMRSRVGHNSLTWAGARRRIIVNLALELQPFTRKTRLRMDGQAVNGEGLVAALFELSEK